MPSQPARPPRRLSWQAMERRREAVTSFDPDRLAAIRVDRKFSVSALARMVDFHRQNLSALEAGRRNAAFDTVLELADALAVDPLELTNLDPAELPISGLRLKRRLSRVELAERCDMSYDLLWAIETGRRPLTDDRAQSVADVLRVDVPALHKALQRELDELDTSWR